MSFVIVSIIAYFQDEDNHVWQYIITGVPLKNRRSWDISHSFVFSFYEITYMYMLIPVKISIYLSMLLTYEHMRVKRTPRFCC